MSGHWKAALFAALLSPLASAVGLEAQQPSCVTPDAASLLLWDRFRVVAQPTGGASALRAVCLTGTSGAFLPFGSPEPAVAVKIVDGSALNERFWVFSSSLSTAGGHTLAVSDLLSQATRNLRLAELASAADLVTFSKAVENSGPRPPGGPLSRAKDLQAGCVPGTLSADFTVLPGQPEVGKAATFIGDTKGCPDSWSWDFEGTKKSGVQVQHTFTEPGTRSVKLTVRRQGAAGASLFEVSKTFKLTACRFTVKLDGGAFRAEGESRTATVVAEPATCQWAVSGDKRHFFSFKRDGGRVTLGFSRNETHWSRSATVRIAGQPFALTQRLSPCTFGDFPTELTIPVNGESGTLKVTTLPGCRWTVTGCPAGDFLACHRVGPADGSGTVSYVAQPNPDFPPRTASVTISEPDGGSARVTFRQTGCSVHLASRVLSFDAERVARSIAVPADSACRWQASAFPAFLPPDQDFLSVSPGSGTGPGSFALDVARNASSLARMGTLSIGNVDFAVRQAGCSRIDIPAFSLPGGFVPRELSGLTVRVQAPPWCPWIAESNSDFLAVDQGAAGRGSGEVEISLISTDVQQRLGTLTVAGHPVTVFQDGTPFEPSCAATATEPESLGPEGGIARFAVASEPGCNWMPVAGTDSKLIAVARREETVSYCAPVNRHARRTARIALQEDGDPDHVTFVAIAQDGPNGGDPAARCKPDSSTLCLWGDRFEVKVTEGDSAGKRRAARIGAKNDRAGTFWFSDKENVELVVKIVETGSGRFQLVAGALTHLPYVVTVTDTETGDRAFRCNLSEKLITSVADLSEP